MQNDNALFVARDNALAMMLGQAHCIRSKNGSRDSSVYRCVESMHTMNLRFEELVSVSISDIRDFNRSARELPRLPCNAFRVNNNARINPDRTIVSLRRGTREH
jgi:hypothetical protein